MKVLISGCGIAGLTLALCLRRHGHEPVLVERAAGLRDSGYMIDFFGSGYETAERLGLLEELGRVHYPIPRLAFVDRAGRERFALPYPRLRELFEGRHFNFLRGDLVRVLHERVRGEAEIRFGTGVRALEPAAAGGGVRATLEDGSSLEADLVAGADGLHSSLRRLLLDEAAVRRRFLGLRTAAFVVRREAVPGVPDDAFSTLSVPGLQVAVYPIRGGRLASFFLHRAETPPQDRSRTAALDELRRVYGRLGWCVPALLEACGDAEELYYDEVTQIELPAWSRGRGVLLGDAAHCVSLVAGQGASLAMAGAFVLAEELAHAARPSELPAALGRYERRLRPAVERKQATGRSMARWFLPDGHVRLALRDAVLRLSAWPPASWLLRRQVAADSVL